MPRLRLHIRYRGARVHPLNDWRLPQIMRRQLPETGSFRSLRDNAHHRLIHRRGFGRPSRFAPARHRWEDIGVTAALRISQRLQCSGCSLTRIDNSYHTLFVAFPMTHRDGQVLNIDIAPAQGDQLSASQARIDHQTNHDIITDANMAGIVAPDSEQGGRFMRIQRALHALRATLLALIGLHPEKRLHGVVVLPVLTVPDGQQLQQLAHVRQAILPGGLGDIGFMDKRSNVVESQLHNIRAVLGGELGSGAVGPMVNAAAGGRQRIQHDGYGFVDDRLRPGQLIDRCAG